ncbi:MAG: OBG GTPase family GTP-binding protein [Candidatus Hodarchaeales archaeon]|jgi:ribosome-interacting GTPase 1
MSEKIEERIAEKEAEMAKMQYNKATQAHFGTLKAQIAQLRSEIVERAMKSKKKGSGFSIKKHGDATVILLGFPSVGKSTLLNAITNKDSKVAAYDFTTLDAIPGMMEYDGKFKGARIQIIDLPGIIEGGASGKGRGREVFAAVRNANLIVILLDVRHPDHLNKILDELYKANIRLDQSSSRIRIIRRNYGGINISGFRYGLSDEEIANIFRAYRIINADVYLPNDPNLTIDQIIDAVADNRRYIPSLVVVNKMDLSNEGELRRLEKKVRRRIVPISAELGQGLNELKEIIVEKVGLMRIFMRKPGEKADLDEPMIVPTDSTVEDICIKLHRRFKNDFRFANIWGTSAKFPGQKVGLRHILEDADIVRIVLEK